MRALRIDGGLQGLCLCVGLLLSACQDRPADSSPQAVADAANSIEQRIVDPALPDGRPSSASDVFWRFRLEGSAEDDPEGRRSLAATVELLDTVDACPAAESASGTRQALMVDRAGGLVRAHRSWTVCVPGCADTAPTQRTPALGRALQATAYQQEFDAPPVEYGPDIKTATMEWRCAQTSTRLTAAAVVALACNEPQCPDVQAVNASVMLGVEHGQALGGVRALFPLQSTQGHPLLAVAPAGPQTR
jgi:hypothetical protein